MKGTSDSILRRMENNAIKLGQLEYLESPLLKQGQPRWHVSPRWITFECGCVAERVAQVHDERSFDPIIFNDRDGKDFLAVYEKVCEKHLDKMNFRVRLGRDSNGVHYRDFKDWYDRRRPLVIGRAR